jgi:hypothetical protein
MDFSSTVGWLVMGAILVLAIATYAIAKKVK